MLKSSDARRRALGTLFLGGALVMLVWGQTALKPHIKGMQFLLYWTACMILTFLTLMTALLDLWIVRRRGRARRTALFKETLLEIQSARGEGDSENPAKSDEPGPESPARKSEDPKGKESASG